MFSKSCICDQFLWNLSRPMGAFKFSIQAQLRRIKSIDALKRVQKVLTRFVVSWKAKCRLVIHRRSPKTRTSRSSWKQAVSARFNISHLFRILRAYTLSVFFILTTHTSPNAPLPMTLRISKSSLHSRRDFTLFVTGFTEKENEINLWFLQIYQSIQVAKIWNIVERLALDLTLKALIL